MNITIEGLGAFRDDISKANSNIKPIIKRTMGLALNAIKNTAQDRAPFISGTLKRSIQWKTENSDMTGIVYQDSNIANYGIYVEYGTKPHIIQALTKKVLANRRENLIFGKIVMHPGTQAKPYMRPAYEENVDKVKGYFIDAIQEIVKIMVGK